MLAEINKAIVRDFMERAFNRGDLSAVDKHIAPDGIDHQEPPGTDFRRHLKEVITMMRAGFPDLHFEIHDMIAEGEIVSFRSTMTGTHRGTFRGMPPTGKQITVPHLHYVRIVNGQGYELWHQWDIPGLMRQLGAAPEQRKSA